MVLQNGDDAYSAIYQHYLLENFPRRFNYQGYFWLTEGDPADPSFRRLQPLPTFDRTEHTDRPVLTKVSPLDNTPKNPFN